MASSSGSSSVDSSHPHSLPGLSSREQIVDALLRACLGIDSNDRALFESAFAVDDPQVSIDVDGRLLQGMPAISKDCFDVVGPMDTHHMTAACRVPPAGRRIHCAPHCHRTEPALPRRAGQGGRR